MSLRTVLLAALGGAAMMGAYAANAQQVTPERLLNADKEPQNWLMIHGNYSNWRNSGLTQINKTNVGQLVPKFTLATGGWGTVKDGYVGNRTGSGTGKTKEEAIPVVNNGFLYIEDGLSKVMKIDVRSGKRGQIVWRYDPQTAIYRNRKGVALMNDKVYVSVGDMRAVALNAETGEAVWETNLVAPTQKGSTAQKHDRQYSTAAPRVVRTKSGKNVVTLSETGTLGYGNHWIAGVDADTGKMLWRFWSIPAPGEPGHDTWKNDAWMTGGGGFWGYPAWDPTTNVFITGTGDCYPTYDPEFRPGDNLYCASTVALDADSGELKWYFAATPNERWDLDTTNNRHLWTAADGTRVVSNFERQGFWYNHDIDRSIAGFKTGVPARAAFLRATQYVDEVTWTKGIDPKTGYPVEYDSKRAVQTYAQFPRGGTPRSNKGAENAAVHCPDWGNQNTSMEPSVLDNGRRMAFATVADSCVSMALTAFAELDAQGNVAAARIGKSSGAVTATKDIEKGFSIVGMNLDTGARKKLAKFPWNGNESGLLGTEGGLLFVAWFNGDVQAIDKDNGNVLWSYSTGVAISAGLISYAVDGKQYIAVQAGSDGGPVSDAPGEQRALGGSPILFVFGLPG